MLNRFIESLEDRQYATVTTYEATLVNGQFSGAITIPKSANVTSVRATLESHAVFNLAGTFDGGDFMHTMSTQMELTGTSDLVYLAKTKRFGMSDTPIAADGKFVRVNQTTNLDAKWTYGMSLAQFRGTGNLVLGILAKPTSNTVYGGTAQVANLKASATMFSTVKIEVTTPDVVLATATAEVEKKTPPGLEKKALLASK